jgi:small-conductance mechanosensitive channel
VAVNRILTVEGIEIPFPQRDLHLRSSDVPIGHSGAAAYPEAHTNTEEGGGKDDPNGS